VHYLFDLIVTATATATAANNNTVVRYSSVGIGTRYGLDGPGSNAGRSEFYCTFPDRSSYSMDTMYFPG